MAGCGAAGPSFAAPGACSGALADAGAVAVAVGAVLPGVFGFAAVAPGVATAAVNSTSASAVGSAGVDGCFAVAAAAVAWAEAFAVALGVPAGVVGDSTLPGEDGAVSVVAVDELLAMAAAAIASGAAELAEPVGLAPVTACWDVKEIAVASGITVLRCAANGCVETAVPAAESAKSPPDIC